MPPIQRISRGRDATASLPEFTREKGQHFFVWLPHLPAAGHAAAWPACGWQDCPCRPATPAPAPAVQPVAPTAVAAPAA